MMIALDMETYGSRDLTKVGLRNYVDDPLFTPLIAVVKGTDESSELFDFVTDGFEVTRDRLAERLKSQTIAAHNAGFERAVLKRIGIDIPARLFVDTAVVSAYYGGGRSLEAAAAQLLGRDKYALGAELIKRFCIPGPYQERAESLAFDPQIREDQPTWWDELIHYCRLDTELSWELEKQYPLPLIEQVFSELTLGMNSVGWPIDLDLVRNMQDRYEMNVVDAGLRFTLATGESELNLSSTQQMSRWCAQRGIRSSSFDEEKVAHMRHAVDKRLTSPTLSDEKRRQLDEVGALLLAKQEMGGSSLKKLEVMARQAADDGRLYDSYLHYGAQATGRTTGRGVQMQNLPRLFGEGDDVSELADPYIHWMNDKLSRNLRQVFRAEHPNGILIVGDFSSVESRGLAWQACEKWKINAYQQGLDLYKVLASRIYSVEYDKVTKPQRQVGKTGELSCGYGAGGGAVHAFAKNMGVSMSEAEAVALVRDWRAANPAIVDWWQWLHDALLGAMETGSHYVSMPWGYVLITRQPAPLSLQAMGVEDSLRIQFSADGLAFTRFIHGVQVRGRNLTYYKPSERKTGTLWTDAYTDPKTGQSKQFTVYGGKLAGLLTQSLCREVFFRSLRKLTVELEKQDIHNVRVIGQFHDELVLEWSPAVDGASRSTVAALLEQCMTETSLPEFPLAAEIKSAHRYVK